MCLVAIRVGPTRFIRIQKGCLFATSATRDNPIAHSGENHERTSRLDNSKCCGILGALPCHVFMIQDNTPGFGRDKNQAPIQVR